MSVSLLLSPTPHICTHTSELTPDKIAKNSELRQVGKAVKTRFWDKLEQRENQSKTTIVNVPAGYYKNTLPASVWQHVQ